MLMDIYTLDRAHKFVRRKRSRPNLTRAQMVESSKSFSSHTRDGSSRFFLFPGRTAQGLPSLPVDILRKVLTNLWGKDLAICCLVSRDLLDHARVQLYRYISVECVSLYVEDDNEEDDNDEAGSYRYEYTTNSFRALCSLFAQPHLGKLVRSLAFITVEEDPDIISRVSTTPKDVVQTFTSLLPGVLSLEFCEWPVDECLSALQSVASRLQDLTVPELTRGVCEALDRSTKLRFLEVDWIAKDTPESTLVALSSSLVHLLVHRPAERLPILVNAAAGTLRTVDLPMISIPIFFQAKLPALVELTILMNKDQSRDLCPTFSPNAPWWTNYEQAESLMVVTVFMISDGGSTPQSEEVLLGPGKGLFRRQLKRINFFWRLPLERLVESFSLLPATPPVQELKWTYCGRSTTDMQLEVIRCICRSAGIEFYPSEF